MRSVPIPIAIITERGPGDAGGVAVASERIARQAVERGHEVHFVSWSKQAPPGARVSNREAALWMHRIGPLPGQSDSLMSLTGHLRDIIVQHAVGLVHGIYAVHAGYAATVAAACERRPSVVSVRGNDFDWGIFRAEQLPFIAHALTHATLVTGVSTDLCNSASRVFAREVVFVPNSVDAAAFRPETPDNSLRATLKLDGEPVIGFLGELREKKGIRFLLPALAELTRTRRVRMLLIGGVRADCRDAYAEFERTAPTAANQITTIAYERNAKRLSRLLALCDVLVFPSLSEGMPNAVLEAMAAARPVLATNVGGHRDLIVHGETGALISTHDLDQLPAAIAEMLDLPIEQRKRLGSAARDFVVREYPPDRESKRYAEVYARAIQLHTQK
jgi:glycosyltransferase involved in cell wall biosynthesis